MGSNTFSQKGVQGARGDRKRERAKCDGRKGKDAARGGSYDDKPAPEFWDHYFREENFQGKTLGEFLNDDPPSLATERTRLAWFEEPHPELFYKEEDLRHFRENGISIGEEEGEGEGEFDYPTDDLDRHHHHHQYAQEGIFCDDEVEEQEEEEEDAFVMPSRVVPRARGGMVETESAAVEDREERGGKPLLTPEELSVGAAAFAAASAAYGRSSSSSAGSASPSSAAAAAATAAASAAAAAGAAVAGEAGFPSQDGVCSIRASGGIAERSSLEGGLGGKRRARQGPGGSTTAASSGTSSSRGLRSGSSGGSKWVSKQHQQQQQRQEQVAGGGKKRRTVMGINGRAGGCGASRNGAGESATNGVDENVVPPKRRRKAGGALAPTTSSIGRPVTGPTAPAAAAADRKDPMQRKLVEFRQKKSTVPGASTASTATNANAPSKGTRAVATKVQTVRATKSVAGPPVGRGGVGKAPGDGVSGRTGAAKATSRAGSRPVSTAPAVADRARDTRAAAAAAGPARLRGAGAGALCKTVSMPVTTVKRNVRGPGVVASGKRGPRGAEEGKEGGATSAGVKRKAPGGSAAAPMVLLSGNVSNVTDRKRRPGANKSDSKGKAHDSSSALSFDEDLKAKLAAHNRGVTKGRHTYEPSKGRVKDWKKWERMTGKKYYSLSPDEKADANKEIADMLAAEREG